jgi:simple sugar transport system permease protein
MYSAPLIFSALGGVISERSGVINIGIEGMMVTGAFWATFTCCFTNNPWLGFLIGGISGSLLALFHAIASVFLKADQTISGVALNLIGPGLAFFFCGLLFDGKTATNPITNKLPKIFGNNNFISEFMGVLNVDITVVIALILTFVIWFFLYKTKWGLRVRAIGEHPVAADALGINVLKLRALCVIVSGFLAGLGGSSVTLTISSQFNQTSISGQGFIALAALIFGKWTPFGAYFACLFFGFSQALAINFGGYNFISPTLLSCLPYFFTLLALMFVGKSVSPKSNGIPYKKA